MSAGVITAVAWTAFTKTTPSTVDAQPAKDAVNLRVYGRVSANLKPSKAVFECESAEKADILLDKLRADLFWDKTLPVKKANLKLGKARVALYSMEGGYGSAVIARSGKKVVIVGGANETEAAEQAKKEPLLRGKDVTSHVAKPRPVCLDYFDNRAFKAYVPPMKAYPGFTLESHWPFLKPLGAAAAFFGPMPHNINPASGVMDWTAQDYEVQEAQRQHDMVVVGPAGGGEVPLWIANQNPDNMMKASDTTLLGDWGGAGMAGAHYESWSASLEDRSAGALGFFLKTMERYRTSPAVGGWMVFAGSPGVEYNFHGRATHAWDTSPVGQAGWRSWLKDQKQWSLADLGTRWYSDAKHFSSWDEVQVPDLNSFFGELGPDSLRLDSGWKWRSTPVEPPAAVASGAPTPVPQIPVPPAATEPGWVPFATQPSQQLAFMGRKGINYYDISFDPSSWVQQQKAGAETWLVFAMIGTGNRHAQAWLNGQALEMPADADSRNASFALRVTGLLKPGANNLQVGLNRTHQTNAGRLAGPVFLTAHEPKHFPYFGLQANARYADFTEWQGWAMTEYHRKMIALARKLDPDRPLVLSGGAEPLTGHAIKLATDYGMGIENTGREASYRPHLPGYGMAAGFYSTSEWSATPGIEALDRGFAWILFDGDASHCLYHDIDANQKIEQETQWFTRHRRQIQLFGKYLRVQPKIALLTAVDASRFPNSAGWDIGRGEIQAAHYDNVYVTEQGLKDGLANRYPLLFDTGSEYMEPDTVAAVRRYVEQGGTFIALNVTAQHTNLEPNTYPLASVSGFKTLKNHGLGKIRFAADLPIFKGWENKEFQGRGTALDWLKEDHAKDSSIALSPNDPSAIPLALWEDGTVAVGYRKLGKGAIITLGSTFWRDGADVAGVWRSSREFERAFLERLFTDYGIQRDASATLPEVWTRKMVSKNGLQNWLTSFNSTAQAQDCDVWVATDSHPGEVINLETNTKVPFEFEANGVKIKGVHFGPYEVKTFAVRRGTLVEGLPVWWDEKNTYWKRTPAEIAAASETLPQPKITADTPLALEKWQFKTDEDHAITQQGQWTSPSFDDSAWKTRGYGAWNLFDPELKNYHGTGLYRIKFTVPQSWDGRRVLLNLYNFDLPIVFDAGEFFINGTSVATYKARGWSQTLNFDVTERVHPGENVLAVKVDGGVKQGGLGGVVWIESRAVPKSSLDLKGAWSAVKGDWLTTANVEIPGSATAKYLVRTVDIPADWKGKTINLDWATKNQWVGAVVVNGHPITHNAAIHPFGTISRVNVTPYILTAQTNTIEIWHHRTVTWNDGVDREEADGMQLNSIAIGCQ